MRVLSLFGLALLLGLLAGCEAGEAPLSMTEGAIMGTDYHVTWDNPAGVDEQQVRAGIFAALSEVEQVMSTYREESDLMVLNRAPINTPVVVKDELFHLLELSGQITRASGGAFDVTVGALVNLWGFGPDARPDQVPDAEQIVLVKAQTGFEHVHLDAATKSVRKERALMIDLSAIAKGYGVDRAAAYLESQGISRYMVEVGGEIRLKGPKPGGKPWRIAIERPEGLREIYGVLELNDAGIATSGDYRNYFEQDGRRYSHTIDPSTGYPITHDLTSVTVLAATSAEADGWATAMMVLGPQAGREVAEREGLAVYFIRKTPTGYEDWASAAFGKWAGKMEKR